jgi:2-dehydropantoate 2-reductase
MRVAFCGAGAVGASFSADMINAGVDVRVIDPWAPHVEAIRASGLRVNTPSGVENTAVHPLHVFEVAEQRGTFDVVFSGVKSYDTRWVAELMKPLMGPDSVFVGTQNGMTIDEVSDILGPERTVGCVVGIAANMPEPGVINREVPREGTWLSVGSVEGPVTKRVEQVHELLSHAAQVEITEDIRSAKWMKLLANIPEMLPSGILGAPLVEAANDTEVRAAMDHASREAYAVANALGVTFTPSLGIDKDAVPDSDQYALDLLDAVLARFSQPTTRVAVLQDWDKGRRAELDAFSGYVVKKGAEIGMPTPVNQAILDLAFRIESGDLAPSWDNKDLLIRAGQA